MPDYFPLFSGGQRVFNASGQPVFARIRGGTVTFTLSATYTSSGAYPIPSGSISGSVNVTATRTAYGIFTIDPTPISGIYYKNSAYIGPDQAGVGYNGYAYILLTQLSFAYDATEDKFKLIAKWEGITSWSPTSYTGGYGVNGLSRTYVKSSSLYIPEGAYVPPATTLTSTWGTVSWDSSVALTFNET